MFAAVRRHIGENAEMRAVYQCSDYREYLGDLLHARTRAGESYSLRSMAKELVLSPTHLSDVLKLKKHLSITRVKKISNQLFSDPNEIEFFIVLFQLNTEKKKDPDLIKKLEFLRSVGERDLARSEDFSRIFHWIHTAIFSLVIASNGKISSSVVAKRLAIPIKEARDRLNYLLKTKELIRDQDGLYRRNTPSGSARTPSHDSELDRYAAEWIMKSLSNISGPGTEDNLFASATIAFDPSQKNQIHSEIISFQRKIDEISKLSSSRSEVFHLGIQFFKVTK